MEFNIKSLNAVGHLPTEAKLVLDEALKKIEMIVERENKRKTKGMPRLGDEYWTFQNNGRGIVCMKWLDEKLDKFLYDIGEVFKSEDEALFALERVKVRTELERLSNVKPSDFYDRFNTHYIAFTRGEIVVREVPATFIDGLGIHFKTAHDAIAAIEAIGAERLKKYYFGM